jgi:hypothetical protein
MSSATKLDGDWLAQALPNKEKAKLVGWLGTLHDNECETVEDLWALDTESWKELPLPVAVKNAIRKLAPPTSGKDDIPYAKPANTIIMNPRDVIKGYTEALYPDFKVFGREMFANAVDAYRWAKFDFNQQAVCTAQELEDKYGTDLRMDLRICAANKMVFEDYGCGMPEAIIRKNYWAIRASSKNTAEAKAAGLIGRFGIGALAMLELCKSMKTTTRNVFDNKTFVTEMDMTQEVPIYTLEEATAADGTLDHAGSRIEATLKDAWPGTKAEWEQLSEKEQIETGANFGAKHLTRSGENGVIAFIRLMFDSMKYTGARVNVDIHSSMAPPQEELGVFLQNLGDGCEFDERADGSVQVKLKGQLMDTSEQLPHAPEQAVETSVSSEVRVQECGATGLEVKVKYTLEARHHGLSDKTCAYVLVKAAEDSKMQIKGKIYLAPVAGPSANKTEVRIFSGGYYMLTMKQIGGRCPAMPVTGDLDIGGLQPTAARDALQGVHSKIVELVMLHVVETLFKLLRERGRNIGCAAVEGLERPYWAMCSVWDKDAIDFFRVTCEQRSDLGLQAEELQLRHIILKGANEDQKLPKGHYFVPAEHIYYCTTHQPMMGDIEKARTLIRLDKIADKGFRAEVQKYLERHFSAHLEDISGWTYKNWYEPDDIDINMSEGPKEDVDAVHWVHKKLGYLCRVFYRIHRSKFAFEIIETDPKIGLIYGAGGRYNPKNKLVIKINAVGSAVLKVGKEAQKRHHGGAMIMLMDTLVDKGLQAKLGNLGKKFELDDLKVGKVLITVGTAESINYGSGGGGSWPGPGTNFVRVSGLGQGNGYYLRLPAEYDTKGLRDLYEEEPGAEPVPEAGDDDDISLAKVLQMSTDLTMFTTFRHCLGTLKPPGASTKGAIEYTVALTDKQMKLKMLQPATYRPPGTYITGNDFIRDFTQRVLHWSTGTFLPVPHDVGEMLNEPATTEVKFHCWVNYDTQCAEAEEEAAAA